jgi:hypothetical protein
VQESQGGFSSQSITGSRSTIVALISAAVVIIGSFMTWVTVGSGAISVSAGGMDEGGDGVITLIVAIAAAAAAIFLKGRARMISIVVGGAVVLLVAIIDIFDILGEDLVDASVGIGLWLVLVGGAALAASAFVKN